MKIISNFRDYYDYVLSYLSEPIYQRVRENINLPELCKKSKNKICEQRALKILGIQDKELIEFQGTLYWNINYLGIAGEIYIIYKDFNEFYFFNIKQKYNTKFEIIEILFKRSENIYNLLKDLFFILKAPIFIINYIIKPISKKNSILSLNFTKNPKLKTLNFNKIKPAEIVAQEISNFLSNDLILNKKVDFTGNDEIRALAKGFDRYSFRNAKKRPKKF